jgi:hypothetical protein
MKLDELKDEVIKKDLIKNFRHQIEFLQSLENWESYKAMSEIPTLNEAEVEIMKGEEAFYYRCKDLSRSKEAPATYQSKGYGFNESFSLLNVTRKIIIPSGVNIMNMLFADVEYSIGGNIRKLHSENFKNGKRFYRAIVYADHDVYESISQYFQTLGFKVDQWFKLAGLIRTANFDLFEYSLDNEKYLIVDSRIVFDFETFEREYKKLIYCYAFVTGHLYRGQTFYFTSPDFKFENIEEFGYEVNERVIKSHMTVIPYRLITAWDKSKLFGETRLSLNDFESIVINVSKHPELYRCIRLMSEAGDIPLELKTSIYSVSLETMRNLIMDDQSSKTEPFKDRRKAKEFIKSIKLLLSEVPDEEFNFKESIIKRIENINQIGNTESFFEIFNMLGIQLTEDDRNSLKKRNEFLHGKIKIDSDEGNKELNYITAVQNV